MKPAPKSRKQARPEAAGNHDNIKKARSSVTAPFFEWPAKRRSQTGLTLRREGQLYLLHNRKTKFFINMLGIGISHRHKKIEFLVALSV